MKVIILCGGQGTRIRDASSEPLPKPMLPIGPRPVLWHIMSLYSHFGYRDFVLCLGHLGWRIKEYFLNYQAMSADFQMNLKSPARTKLLGKNKPLDWKITFAETGEETQTGSRLAKIAKYIAKDPLVMLTYGDGVADVNVRKLVEFHKRHGKAGTITGVRPSSRFGEITYDKDGVIREFNEKPQTAKGRINGGFMVFNPRKLLSYIPQGNGVYLEREPLIRMARDGQLRMFPHEGFWQPMDTYREYKLLNDLWSRGAAPWKLE